MKILDIQEDGSQSFTGSANIAANPSRTAPVARRSIRNGDADWHNAIERQRTENPHADRHAGLQAQGANNMRASREKLAKKKAFLGRLKQFFADKQRGQFRISESFDMNDVISKMSSLEGENEAGTTISYGVEDDNGNMMKVTVRADQAEEFEDRLANELADAARRQEVTGSKTSISMAELLYTLNDEFDIVDVVFPQIPTDAVYNADKVQYGVADTGAEDISNAGEETFGTDGFPENAGGDTMGGDTMGGAVGGGLEGDMEAEGGDAMGGDPMAAGGEEGGEGGDEFFGDDASVEDFPEDPAVAANPEDNLLTSILKMLTADADSRKAEADARAEEARAKQAEYSAMSAKNSVAQQEEVARMEAEIEKSKKQEKDARRISDLARYRVGKASGYTESEKPTFGKFLNIVLEFDEFDTVAGLNKQRAAIRLKFAPESGDDPETQAYKRNAMTSAMMELNAKMKRVSAAEKYRLAVERRAKLAGKQPMPGQPSMNPQQQAQTAQQQTMANGQQMGQ